MRILLLEDHQSISEAIAIHLKSRGFSVDTVACIREAQLALGSGDFDAALFDLSLPDGDGVDLIMRLRRAGNRLPIIIMTARDRITDRIRGLEAGADDYVVKPFDLNEIVARMHAVLRRYSGNPSPQLKLGRMLVDRAGHRVLIDGEDVNLAAKEWAVLDKLVANSNSIISKRQLEETLYGFNEEIESNTIEVYISRLRKKIGKGAVETVRGLGYRFNPDCVQ
jgi:two-component system, OmpR family, response regulator